MNNLARHSAVTAFADAARRYRALIKDRKGDASTFPTACAEVLADLYACGLRLPVEDPGQSALSRTVGAPKTARFWTIFDDRAWYRGVYAPLSNHKVYQRNLADDLSDIYGDIVSPLFLFDRGTPSAVYGAVWEWRFAIMGHAGEHMTSALRALHEILSDQERRRILDDAGAPPERSA